MNRFRQAVCAYTQARRKSGRLRVPRALDPLDAGRIRLGQRELINFAGNDYLGLSRHPALAANAALWMSELGCGSTASPLVCGRSSRMAGLEAKLADLKGCEAAMLFPSGYQAGLGLMEALLDPKVLGCEPLVFADKLNHASLHAGCRLALAKQKRFRHLDLNHLESLLAQSVSDPAPRFIITESVFSMDGDRTDLAGLAALAKRYDALLYVDEAHSTGILGPHGRGLCSELASDPQLELVVMGTGGKALGAGGAFACGKAWLMEYLVNRCGSFIYSTALAPATAGALDAAIDLLPGLEPERQRVAAMSAALRETLHAAGIRTGGSSTQIVPAMVGSDTDAQAVARHLDDAGFLGVAIRPPTVPEGSARIRVSVTAAHQPQDVEALGLALVEAYRTQGLL